MNEYKKTLSHPDGAMHVLAFNSGSSSLKFGLYHVHEAENDCLLTGEAENIGHGGSIFHAAHAQNRTMLRETAPIANQHAAVMRIGRLLASSQIPAPQAIGHRIVHGGPALREHCVINESVMQRLEATTVFAPLHTPAALDVIRFATDHFPGRPQVACLDTSFHARMPIVASTLPLPLDLRIAGIQRYGFHGLSCESILAQLAGALPLRLIIAHLGNGASITAAQKGVSLIRAWI